MTTTTTKAITANIQEERLLVAQMARNLEANPLSAEAEKQRQRLKSWIEEAPDFTVPVMPELLDLLETATTGRAPEIYAQMILSSAAFAIEHPGSANDNGAICAAGLEGALRAYEAILALEPDCRRPKLDDLSRRMREGTLSEYVWKVANRVAKEPKDLMRFLSFRGRIGRKSFWLRAIAVNVYALLALIVVGVLAQPGSEPMLVLMGLFSIVAMSLLVAFLLAAEIQRWHDLGRSGYMVLINLIPILGGIVALIWLGFVKGNQGPNKYGRDPLGEDLIL